MKQRIPYLILVFFFVGLIATAVTLNRRSARPGSTSAATGDQKPRPAAPDALERYGFKLTDATAKAGISAVHQAPKLDPKLAPILERVADMGAGVSVADFDRDGWQDIYITNSGENSKNFLYRNNHDGTFADVATEMGVADVNKDGTGVSMGAVWGDYDNDGFEDLLVYKWGRTELYHNDGGKKFTDVTDKANLPRWCNANTAIWWDYDRDGKLDVFIGGYFDEKIDLWNLKTTAIMPDSLEYATNGTRKYLLRGRGDGTFEDVTAQVGLTSKSWTLAAVAADLRGTGYPDLFLANDYGFAELWVNEGGKKFRNVGAEAGIANQPKSGMNAALGDVTNNGKFAIYVSNISERGNLLQGNNLWVPREGTPPGKLAYDNAARDMNVELAGWAFGAQFGDLDNDGYQDIYLTNGYISGDQNQDSYWYDYSKVSGGNQSIIRDVANWPAIKGRSLSGYQQKCVFKSDGAGRFTDVSQSVGATDRYDGRAVALADLFNKGSLDVLVSNQRGPALLYRNEVKPENAWIGFDLEGTRSNRSAIGAIVKVTWDGQTQAQVVTGGMGFCAQNDRRLHFGLGKNTKIEKVEIAWPSGARQVVTKPEVGKMNKVKEA